ncbi:MAG: hypothetical protein RL235_598 [Chlamydiota bacterium]
MAALVQAGQLGFNSKALRQDAAAEESQIVGRAPSTFESATKRLCKEFHFVTYNAKDVAFHTAFRGALQTARRVQQAVLFVLCFIGALVRDAVVRLGCAVGITDGKLEEGLVDLFKDLAEYKKEKDPKKALNSIVHRAFGRANSLGEEKVLTAVERAIIGFRAADTVSAHIHKSMEDAVQGLADILNKGIANGTIKEEDLQEFIETCLGLDETIQHKGQHLIWTSDRNDVSLFGHALLHGWSVNRTTKQKEGLAAKVPALRSYLTNPETTRLVRSHSPVDGATPYVVDSDDEGEHVPRCAPRGFRAGFSRSTLGVTPFQPSTQPLQAAGGEGEDDDDDIFGAPRPYAEAEAGLLAGHGSSAVNQRQAQAAAGQAEKQQRAAVAAEAKRIGKTNEDLRAVTAEITSLSKVVTDLERATTAVKDKKAEQLEAANDLVDEVDGAVVHDLSRSMFGERATIATVERIKAELQPLRVVGQRAQTAVEAQLKRGKKVSDKVIPSGTSPNEEAVLKAFNAEAERLRNLRNRADRLLAAYQGTLPTAQRFTGSSAHLRVDLELSSETEV